ncbi:armadillo/beta-catenin-like repeat-containing protein, putative [Eimeria necatrix]|uniref:Armadillo/beta-catenin-like repeat-containing protein, putative n=1 Tax=Eimeria necatrix TaxID=51315 RepID=U6N445_9EIME|nr:armadillo/beta-catenin-like repeat-containing protein, putative [Eimeria necatrix]CDJ68705.1 armadillo/beta-catenin-like repeat-containing protein, putative [Eimeria necatrix]
MLHKAAAAAEQQQLQQMLPLYASPQQCKRHAAPPAAPAYLDDLTARLTEQLSLSRPPHRAADKAAAAPASPGPCSVPPNDAAAESESPEVLEEVTRLLEPLPKLLHNALEQQQQQQQQQHNEVVVMLLKGVRGLRQLLSAAGEIPIAACLRAGALPLLVGCLAHHSKALMLEAAWCLTNLGSGSSADAAAVVSCGTLGFIFCSIFSFSPESLALPCSPLTSPRGAQQQATGSPGASREASGLPTEEEAFEQLLWALGNITGDSAAYRDIVLSQELLQEHVRSLLLQPPQQHEQLQRQQEAAQRHAITPQLQQLLLQQLHRIAGSAPQQCTAQLQGQPLLPSLHQQVLLLLQHAKRPQTWRTAVWLISNLCRGTPRPEAKLLSPLVPLLRHALQQASPQQVLPPQQHAELILQQETLADVCWAIDGLVTRPEGVSLLLQTPPLLLHVVHALAHSSGCCCCAVDSTPNEGVEGNAASNARTFELDVLTGRRNRCCRVCNPQLAHLLQDPQQQQHMLLPLHPALRIIGQIAAGTARHTQQLLSSCCCMRCLASATAAVHGSTGSSSNAGGCLPPEETLKPCCSRGTPVVLRCLRALLIRVSLPSLCREACWALSNLAVGNSEQLQQLLQCNIPQYALMLLEQPHLGDELRKEALWLVSNACTTAATFQQLLVMLQHGALRHLWALLEAAAAAADGRAAEAALNAIYNVVFLAEAAQQQRSGMISCGCCGATAAAAQCSCCCHKPLLLLSSLMPGDEGLMLLQQVRQQHLTDAADIKSDQLACKLLHLRNTINPSMSSGGNCQLFVN